MFAWSSSSGEEKKDSLTEHIGGRSKEEISISVPAESRFPDRKEVHF